MAYVKTPEEFLAENRGDEMIAESAKGNTRTFICPTGAVVERGYLGDKFFDPPADELERLRLRSKFHQLWKLAAQAAFADLKMVLLGIQPGRTFKWDNTFGPAPTEREPTGSGSGGRCGIAALKRLKAIHDHHAQAVAKIEAEIDNMPQVKLSRLDEEMRVKQLADFEASRREQVEERMEAIRAIRLDGKKPGRLPKDELAQIRDLMKELRHPLHLDPTDQSVS